MEITKADIVSLIEEKQTDTFLTHLWTILKSDYRPAGEVHNRILKVWKQNGWNSLFYPVFSFELNQQGILENISDRLNSAGKIIFIFVCGLLSLPWLYWVYEDFDPSKYWLLIVGYILLLGALIFIGRKVYKMERNILLEEIFEALEIEYEQPIEKEWSWKKIIT
ncbi:hypothetical protein [Arenibacter troitsensis]|uniref:Uncharacterized protein n=1 Tax=Arenibacter troitsensis TaxID=188872 RepID=A0A1X7LKQ0_9FLAO|nr:hypothetical protein [Arenibacter troitsensis]SMG53832.1 hypothetical protein SAMN03080602_04413 [Arenibacter troitsensis]